MSPSPSLPWRFLWKLYSADLAERMAKALTETMMASSSRTTSGMDLHWEIAWSAEPPRCLLQVWTSPAGKWALESAPTMPDGPWSWQGSDVGLPF